METDPTKEIAKVVWSLGDYEQIAKLLLPAALQLVDAVGIRDGEEVLDVATGSGNVAILCAQRGARVSACDLTPSMLELARRRAEREGVEIDFREGDAEELPYEDDRFDRVFSTFGVMFAPRPQAVARELFRVAKPGGVVGLASWTPDGLIGRQAELMQSYAPSGGPRPQLALWGTEEGVAQQLAPYASSLETARLNIREEFESWDAFVEHRERYAGPAIALKQSLDADRYAEMTTRLRELYDEFNQARDGTIVVDAEYLQVTARKG